ncbi:MAG: aminotransferase class I/II-fold pyridoxal phosphate-dependent enzyme [Candidatus Wildermuthbacteria bacterium]|nr:aminotransferase class I/II-fold pyridoxal phosphate-dependent enzyme [Candidatus Wildermuthbacteria bacterium]
MISISLSPNTEPDDIRLAFKLLFQPWRWQKGNAIETLEKEFADYLGAKHAISFNSGRSALLAILDALELEKDDEVLLQAFTCNAVPNPVIWSGLKPVYVDCNESDFNIDAADLEKKITPKSRAVVVQHTFGILADLEKIMQICKEHGLILIEDCAHALGAKYKGREAMSAGRQVGTLGKVAFFSFSRDKVISSVYGGMATTNDPSIAQKIRQFQDKVSYPSHSWILQQLLHPVIMNIKILPFYAIGGKYLLIIAQWLHILSKAVHWKEKRGLKPSYFPRRLPNALAILAFHQFKKLNRFNQHRKEIAELYSRELVHTKYQILNTKYQEGGIFLRFPVQHPNAHEIIKKAWAKNILIGDWYTFPIAPDDTQLDKLQYEKGNCPNAERLSQITLNLPTHVRISRKEAYKIIEILKGYAS